MAIESTMDKLYEMRLSVMARAYRDQDEAPGTQELGFDERIAMLVDAEWDARRTNKRTKLLRAAGFSVHDANVADIRYDADRKLDRAKILELSNASWVKERRNLVITGSTGAGKTWLACALGVAACNAFFTVRYVRLPQMMDDLTVNKDIEWLKAKKRYVRTTYIIDCDSML